MGEVCEILQISFFLKHIRTNTSVPCVVLPVFWHKTIFWKIFSKVIRKKTMMGFVFSEVAGCEVTKKRTSIMVSFGWIFGEIFQISFFLNQLQCSGRSYSICASKFWHWPFGVHSNYQGADEIKHLQILIDFRNRNTELLSCLMISMPLRNSTTIIIRLTKQMEPPCMQSLRAVSWNSSPEKNLNIFRKTSVMEVRSIESYGNVLVEIFAWKNVTFPLGQRSLQL